MSPIVGVGVGVGFPRRAGGAAFVGAYDAIPDLAAVYGMRRTLSSYEGALIRLRRSSDNAEQDIGALANGDLDTSAASTFIGAGSGFIVTWYDQSGSAFNATQATAANQPLYVASGQNSRPVARFDGVDDGMSAGVTIGTTWSVMTAAIATGTGGASSGRLWSARGDRHVVIPRNSSANRVWQNGTSALAVEPPITTPALFAIVNNTAYLNGANDGTITTGTLGAGDLWLGNRANLDRGLAGDIFEMVVADATWSTADREAAESAANAYFEVY